MFMRRLSSIFCTLASLKNAFLAALPMMRVSTLAKPPWSTWSTQSPRLPRMSALEPPHLLSPDSSTLLLKPKSMISFTPSPTMGILPVTMACTAIHSSRRVVASFRVAYSSISFWAARWAGVMPL